MSQAIGFYEERRERMVQEIRDLCAALNMAGCDPLWTPGRLHLYINARYEVEDGLDSLSGKELIELNAKLSSELEALTGQGTPAVEMSIA